MTHPKRIRNLKMTGSFIFLLLKFFRDPQQIGCRKMETRNKLPINISAVIMQGHPKTNAKFQNYRTKFLATSLISLFTSRTSN